MRSQAEGQASLAQVRDRVIQCTIDCRVGTEELLDGRIETATVLVFLGVGRELVPGGPEKEAG